MAYVLAGLTPWLPLTERPPSHPPAQVVERGRVSWYRDTRTASGEPYQAQALRAAHRTLPFGTWLRVYYPARGTSVTVKVNDRGPYIRGRVLDLTPGAFVRLAPLDHGVIPRPGDGRLVELTVAPAPHRR